MTDPTKVALKGGRTKIANLIGAWQCVVFAILVLMVSPARAWNSFGHMEVAAIAWENLTPAERHEATRLLKLNSRYKAWVKGVPADQRSEIGFVKAATWPDEIKLLKNYKTDGANNGDVAPHTPEASQNIGYRDHFRHKYWHFIDEPFSTDGTPLNKPVAPNAETQIATFRTALSDHAVSDNIRSYDLAWLLHLVADVHQPLHSTSRFTHLEPNGDAGGNKVDIACTACGGAKNLHAFWDDLLGDGKAPPSSAIEAAKALPPPDPTLSSDMNENDWINESFTIAKESVYSSFIGDTDGPFQITDDYRNTSLEIAKKQVALAGARLSNLLKEAFK